MTFWTIVSSLLLLFLCCPANITCISAIGGQTDNKSENVQRRAIGMVSNFKSRTYEEKLAEARMVTLETRRLRGDLLQTYRVLKGIDDVDPSKWFTMAQGRGGAMSTRHTGGVMNVERGEAKGEIRRNFWSQRVVDPWNN